MRTPHLPTGAKLSVKSAPPSLVGRGPGEDMPGDDVDEEHPRDGYKRRILRAAKSDVSDKGSNSDRTLPGDGSKERDGAGWVRSVAFGFPREKSMLYKALVLMHALIPKQLLLPWLTNLRSVLDGLCDEIVAGVKSLSTGSGRSGSDIWIHALDLATRFWAKESSLFTQPPPFPLRSAPSPSLFTQPPSLPFHSASSPPSSLSLLPPSSLNLLPSLFTQPPPHPSSLSLPPFALHFASSHHSSQVPGV